MIKQYIYMKKQILVVLLLLWGAAISTSIVQGAVRLAVPGESPGMPAYARISSGGPLDLEPVPHNGEWAVIVFYRDPGCVPADFNLVDFFAIPAVFDCPLTMSGFEIWEGGEAPIMSHMEGLGAVPVWFVSWPELAPQVSDGVLTINDLESLNPLIGSASFCVEELRPTGGVKHPTYSLVAHGQLADGRSFQVELAVSADHTPQDGDKVASVNISFK